MKTHLTNFVLILTSEP